MDAITAYEVASCPPESTRTMSQPSRHLSSQRTSTSMQHERMLDAGFDDYTPSQHIMNDSEEDYITEDDLLMPDPAPSGRSSISSFPSSVVHHNMAPDPTFSQDEIFTPSRSRTGTPTAYSQTHKPTSPIASRRHITGFRNPSSVRALQMRDEFSDGEDYTPGHKRRVSRMSYISYRSGSAHSTPGKRLSRSLQGSPVKNTSKLRKEFPLVLLHCTMLPSLINPKAGSVAEDLLEAIVPEPYKKRWKLLQEKVVKNVEVRERGVLIPHPKDDYDLLEEKILESLELEHPVINNGHYVGRSESRASVADSGFGSEENSSRGDATDEEGEEPRCADCGGQVCAQKRWEVKVFAANGLMKAGAWGAAWSEMEKVDVQVSVWLPEAVRQEIGARLEAVIAQEQQLRVEEVIGKEEIEGDERTREIYGESTKSMRSASQNEMKPESRPVGVSAQAKQQQPHVDLQAAFVNYARLLLQDRRNIAIVLLSIMLVVYSLTGRQITSTTSAEIAARELAETTTEYLTTTIFSTSTSTDFATSTVTKTATSSLPFASQIPEESEVTVSSETGSEVFCASPTLLEDDVPVTSHLPAAMLSESVEVINSGGNITEGAVDELLRQFEDEL